MITSVFYLDHVNLLIYVVISSWLQPRHVQQPHGKYNTQPNFST
jgi:hypothetical protein